MELKHEPEFPRLISLKFQSYLTNLRVFLFNKIHIALGFILAVGAYLRLWNIQELFNAVHDFDEAVYSEGARFISQGHLPYRDFVLAHPPFFSLILAIVYKIFGYNYFYGKYLSIALSLACIILIFLIAKKLFHPGPGLVAAAIFAVSPDMVYPGRRVVQESLGIFLLLIAIFFAIEFINKHKKNRLLVCGISLGLAAATKYIFIPGIIAIVASVVLILMGDRFWKPFTLFGKSQFWIFYLSLGGLVFSILIVLKWALGLPLSIPFIDTMGVSLENFAIVIVLFVMPLIVAIVMTKENLNFNKWKRAFIDFLPKKDLLIILVGIAAGFFGITGFFLCKMPRQFIDQTFLLQTARPNLEFPSFIAMLVHAPGSPSFLKLAFLPILLAVPLVVVILNRRNYSREDAIVTIGIIFALLFSQGFYHLPRYYISVYPFVILGISSFAPKTDVQILKTQWKEISNKIKGPMLGILAVLMLF